MQIFSRPLMHLFAYLQQQGSKSKEYKECILLYFGNVGHTSSHSCFALRDFRKCALVA